MTLWETQKMNMNAGKLIFAEIFAIFGQNSRLQSECCRIAKTNAIDVDFFLQG